MSIKSMLYRIKFIQCYLSDETESLGFGQRRNRKNTEHR